MEILRRESQLEKMVLLEYFHQYLLQKFMLLKRKGRQEPSYLWPFPRNNERFHGIDDCKKIWEAIIRYRFGGNANSKRCKKVVLKQQFEAFYYISSERGLELDRSDSNITLQLEAHGAGKPIVMMDIKRNGNKLADSNVWLFEWKKFYKKGMDRRGRIDGKQTCGMTSNSKVGLGYEIQSNNEVLSYEEEMNRTVFKCTEEDFLNKPLYSRFSKTDNFKGVPHPLTGDYTPKPQEEIDDSLYVYGKKGPQKPETSVSDDKFSENSVTSSEEVVSEPKPKEAEPSCVTHVKTPRQPMKNQGTPKVKGKNWNEMMERELGEGYSFIKKKCFVCGSLSHLIRDCDFYEKKMAREAELKKQRVFNTGKGVVKPVWNNANRVNHANQFVPRPVQLNTGRANINSVRPNVNTGRATVNSVRQNVNSVRSNVNTGSFNINTVKAKQPINTSNSNSFSHVRPQGIAVKTSAGYNWRRTRPNSNYNSGSNFVRTDHPLKNMEDRGIFDSGCSRHMTGNKDHLDYFEECKWGSVTFGGSKGYITGKGRIRVGNLKEKYMVCEIVDFLKGLKIRYALTHNPTIHDSLVKQFWQTATATTLADGTLELRATIDTLEYTITEASIRSKLEATPLRVYS
ncbi:ribonuclease H-like domain-containing protein [Tanacetum coccineum]